ncbi:MAG: sugar ABC transporter permease [Spirochaetia bacterium]|jgi:multiple sugar transport system permease protein
MDSARTAVATRGRISARRVRDALSAYLFISPSALIIGVFGIFPLFFTVYVSLFKWRLTRGSFFGLGNYESLFGAHFLPVAAFAASIGGVAAAAAVLWRAVGLRRAGGLALLAVSIAGTVLSLPLVASQGDSEVFDSLRVTSWYALLTVPAQLAAGLAIALLLTRKIRGRSAFRVMYLLPYIAPTVATAAVFELLFSLRPDSFANQLIGLFGATPLQWLQEPRGIIPLVFGLGAPPSAGAVASYWMEWARGPSLALLSIVFFSWWVFVGYYALIYINGLGSIPRQLYEAAQVDGAGRVRSFFSITLPLLSPTTFFLTLLGIIGTFKAFTHLYVLRTAAAAGTADPISVEIFFTFFRKAQLGYASATSIVLFLIVLGLTLIQQRTLERRVSYGD